MRPMICGALLVLVSAPLWALEATSAPAAGEMPRQTEYTCNDGTSEGYFNLTDIGEGFANRFTPAMYPSRIEAVTIAAYYSVDRGGDRDIQTCVAYVWTDAGGQPGAVLWSGPASFDVTTTSWFAVPIGSDIVIESGSFWVGYLDDGSLTVTSPYDDPDACGTYYYYPAAGSWMPLADLGYPYGVYLGATVGEGVPVELASFDAGPAEEGVRIIWRTLSETDCFGFYTLRSENAEDLGVRIEGSLVPGQGSTTIPHDYHFLDTTVSTGIWYYRLVQMDTDGSETMYGPVSVRLATTGSTSWGRIKSEFNQ